MAALTEAAGISRSTLHHLENGNGNPRMDTLYALARVLKVPLSDLIRSPAEDVGVIRSFEGTAVAIPGIRARLLQRFTLLTGTLELSEVHISADTNSVNGAHQRGTYEHLYVTSGMIEIGPQEAPQLLQTGDYIKFRADTPHLYRAHEGPVTGVMLMEYTNDIQIVGHADGARPHD